MMSCTKLSVYDAPETSNHHHSTLVLFQAAKLPQHIPWTSHKSCIRCKIPIVHVLHLDTIAENLVTSPKEHTFEIATLPKDQVGEAKSGRLMQCTPMRRLCHLIHPIQSNTAHDERWYVMQKREMRIAERNLSQHPFQGDIFWVKSGRERSKILIFWGFLCHCSLDCMLLL